MTIRRLGPFTAARRRATAVVRASLTKARPLKRRVLPWHDRAGRNALGRITVRHRGGSAKRRLRIVDFGEEKEGVPGRVEALEYDPFRSAFLARITYRDGDRRYRLAWEGATVGSPVLVATTASPTQGNRLPLEKIPVGSPVMAIEVYPRRGARLVRSAGLSATLQDVSGAYAQVLLPSGEVRRVPKEAWATVGTVSNPDHGAVRVGGAGRARRRGRRPSVRGKAMNPVDHPHGGGEGHTPIGLTHPKTPWGRPALGPRTRRQGKYSDRFIVRRRA